MSRVVEHLAELTGFRDRDVLDVSLVAALKDLVRPEAVAIYRAVGEPGRQRWLTRARIRAGERTAGADSMWTELEALPTLAALPAHHQCFKSERIVARPGTPSLTLFPLTSDREVVGVLELNTPDLLPEDQQRLVFSILRIYRNFQALLDYSERDTLTGLLNRKTFDECFLRLAQMATEREAGDGESPAAAAAATGGRGGDAPDTGRRAESGQRAFLGVIDIDHFKRVNDRYGHLIGDEVLLLLSRLMNTSFRFHDRLFRFGGEEFVVLMRCRSATDAAPAFERLRANVEAYEFPRVGRITVSVGFTELRAGDAPAAAFERADRAVYIAKERGRNQVHDHAALVRAGVLADDSHEGDVELF